MSIRPTAVESAQYILMATSDHRVAYIDAAAIQDLGAAFTGEWISQSLNREDKDYKYTLTALKLFYTSLGGTDIEVSVSPDGGSSWPVVRTVPIELTVGTRVKIARLADVVVTGDDLRFRIRFASDVPVLILKYRPKLVKRSASHYG